MGQILAWAVAVIVAAGLLALGFAARSHGGLLWLAARPSARHVAALRRGVRVPGRYLWRITPRPRRRRTRRRLDA